MLMALSIPPLRHLVSLACLLVQQGTMCIRSLLLAIDNIQQKIDLCLIMYYTPSNNLCSLLT